MKTSELQGPALDWAVGHASGRDYDVVDGAPVTGRCLKSEMGLGYDELWEPSANWEQGGPIIERGKIGTLWEARNVWSASTKWDDPAKVFYGKTKLIAAMRCYVASKLGDEVEIPEALI